MFRFSSSRIGGRLSFLVVVGAFSLAANCGGDDVQGAGDGNGGGGGGGNTVTVLSATTSDGWTSDLFVQEQIDADCQYHSHHAADINEVWVTGGFAIVTQSRTGNNCCRWIQKTCTLNSARFDLTPCTSARLKGRLRMYCEKFVQPGGKRCEIRLHLRANTPGTTDLLDVVREDLYANAVGETIIEQDIDISLENSLSWDEASIEMSILVSGGCGGTNTNLQWNEVYLELLDFEVVGQQ